MANDEHRVAQPDMIQRNLFILVLITQLVSQLQPEFYEKEIRSAAQTRHHLLQRIITKCGMLRAAYFFVSPNQPEEIISQALRLIASLIECDNRQVLEELFVLMQEESFNFLSILNYRIKACIDNLLGLGKWAPQPYEKTLHEKVYEETSEVTEPDLINQPFYLPDGWTIEAKLQQMEPTIQLQELLFMLQLVQKLVKGYWRFQEIIVNQEGKSEQVDLVFCIGESLIRITEIVQEKLYYSFKISQCVAELFKTLYLMADH
jgi:hypothetical protein